MIFLLELQLSVGNSESREAWYFLCLMEQEDKED